MSDTYAERLEQAYRQRLHPDQPSEAYHGLETQMSKLRRGLARLIDSYAEGLIDKQEFEPRVTHMRARLQHLEAQMQHLKAEGELEEGCVSLWDAWKPLPRKCTMGCNKQIFTRVGRLFGAWSSASKWISSTSGSSFALVQLLCYLL